MKELKYSIIINAKAEKIWDVMWHKETYSKWNEAFSKDTYYETTEFKEGNKIHLLTKEGHGMFSVFHHINKPEKLIFKHLGEIENFKEVTPEKDQWEDAFETYQLVQHNGKTELNVSVYSEEKYIDMMNDMFPKALSKLKKLAEA
ncbi:MAG: SRPBCC domain-containing protein [Bacteroidota bacterium]